MEAARSATRIKSLDLSSRGFQKDRHEPPTMDESETYGKRVRAEIVEIRRDLEAFSRIFSRDESYKIDKLDMWNWKLNLILILFYFNEF